MFQVFQALTFNVCFGTESCQHRTNKSIFMRFACLSRFSNGKITEPVFVAWNLENFVMFILADGLSDLTTTMVIKLKFEMNSREFLMVTCFSSAPRELRLICSSFQAFSFQHFNTIIALNIFMFSL